ncbi:MAG: sulfurtransferase TusA family protein [Thermoleophilia bacterium]
MTPVVVDALGTWCPVPIHLVARAAARAGDGDVIELLADDPLIAVDLPAWCHAGGHELTALREEDGSWVGVVTIRSGGPPAGPHE